MLRAWRKGTVAVELATAGPDERLRIEAVRRELTLRRRGYGSQGSELVPFWLEEQGWFHAPGGYLLSDEGRALLSGAQVWEGRSDGRPLPDGAFADAVFGQAPYPEGQPAFIQAIVDGCRANGHGGLALAPTRSGKTLCSVEAACRLGRSTLILVDRTPLLEQWREAVARVRDRNGAPVPCGTVRAELAEWDRPFVVAMVETLARRALPDEVRRAFGLVIVDECQSAPCDLIWTALRRLENKYVVGLTATPDRADGLGPAIKWLIGPPIASLERELAADVHFLHVPYRAALIEKPVYDDATGEPIPGQHRMGKARLTRFGDVDSVQAEKALMADAERVQLLADEASKASRAGRQVLVLAGLREHVTRLANGVARQGIAPGIYVGGESDRAAMRKPVVIATYGIAAKGLDFQPPPTLLILAAPRSDVRQAVGRVLQPQAPHKPMVVDVVDGAEPLIKQARRRARFYREKKFDVRNDPWPEGMAIA